MQRSPSLRRSGMLVVGAVILLSWALLQRQRLPEATDGAIEELFADNRSGVMVETAGEVVRVLQDDLQGSRHQRFVVRLASGHTVLISHNIDLAPRVEGLSVGDRVTFRGQYEWNDRGGVVHWTHHDPDGERPGGWIQHEGGEYR